MERKMTIKDFFAPTATRLGGARVRRAAMLLLMMLLTTATAWPKDYTVTYMARFIYTGVTGLYNTSLLRIDNTGLSATIAERSSAWPGNTGVCVNDEYVITFKPSSKLSIATNPGTTTATGFTMSSTKSSSTSLTASVANNSSYYIKQVKLLDQSATTGTSAATAPNSRSATVSVSNDNSILFNVIEVTLTDDYYGTITPQNGLTVGTVGNDASLTYNGTNYYRSGTTITMNAPANHIIESASGVSGANIAADQRSYTFAMPKQNVSPGAGMTEVHTISSPSGLTVTTNPYFTYNTTKYYKKGETYTLTVDDANKAIKTFSASGASNSSVAADKKSATVTIGSSNVTVTATLMALTGTSNGVTWSLSDTDSNGTYDRLTLSGSGTLSTSLWDSYFAASISRVDVSSAGINIGGNPFSSLAADVVIVVPTLAYAVSYANATFASKLRVAFGSQLFGATTTATGTAAYKIATADDLRNLSAAVNDGNNGSGKTFLQTASIDLKNGGNFTPIGIGNYNKNKFAGTYDGGGKTISGLIVNDNACNTGLFSILNGGTIRNVILVNPIVSDTYSGSTSISVGTIAGYCYNATIENCHAINPNVSATGTGNKRLGALLGEFIGTATNCYYYSGNQSKAIGYGVGTSGVTATRVSAAHLVTLGDNVTATPAIGTDGTNGFSYGGTNYWREGLEMTLGNTLSIPTGYHAIYKAGSNTLTGNTYTVSSSDVTLTVEYTNNTYTVKFNGNGGTCDDGEMSDQTFTYGTAQNLTANAFTRTGYTFAGWAESENGDVVYKDQESVNNLVTTNGGTKTLYAKWTINQYTITFVTGNGGTAIAPITQNYDTPITAPADPERKGYTFAGWDKTIPAKMPADNMTITALWNIDTYTITYHVTAEGANFSTDKVSYTVESDKITLDQPTREDYTFAGWYTNSDHTGKPIFSIAHGSTGNLDLYDSWRVNIPYIDADGNKQICTDYRLLGDNSSSSSNSNWVVVNPDINIGSTAVIIYTQDEHIILCDGANLTATMLRLQPSNLTIYGQSDGTGTLNLTGFNGSSAIIGFSMKDLRSSLTINGGKVNLTIPEDGPSAISLNQSNFTFNGGQVTAIGGSGHHGIEVKNGTITLGWHDATDFIEASSYNRTVNIASGKAFTDGIHGYSGNDVTIPAGVKLTPACIINLPEGINATGVIEQNGTTAYALPGATVTMTAPMGYTCSSITVSPTVNVTDNGNGTYSFTMPAEGVTVSVALRSDRKRHSISYMKADGTTDTHDAIALDETITFFNPHYWYYVGKDVTFDENITLSNGEVTLILCDGKTMNIGTDANHRLSGIGLKGEYDNASALIIYGQSLDPATAGHLNIYTNGGHGIYLKGPYTQHSGNVTIDTQGDNSSAIYNDYHKTTLNGGTLRATTNVDHTIYGHCGDIIINGGKLDAIYTGDSPDKHALFSLAFSIISLGYTNANDHINASSCYADRGTMKIADGQTFYNGSEVLSGTISNSDIESKLNGKTLTPAIVLADNSDNTSAIATATTACTGDKTLAVQLSGRTLYKDGNWNTLCLPFSMTASQIAASPLADATIKELDNTASGTSLNNEGLLTLKFNAADEIVAGTPYMIKWETTGENIENPVFTGVTISSTEPTPVVSNDSKVTFVGQYSPFAIDETNINSVIMLSSGNRLGFSNTNRTLRPFRAHFEVPAEDLVRDFVLDFGDETTGVVSIDHSPLTIDHSADAWYSLDGRKLDNVPTKKGLYIVNGRKVVIK